MKSLRTCLCLYVLLSTGCAHYDHLIFLRLTGEIDPQAYEKYEEISLYQWDSGFDDMAPEKRFRYIGKIESPEIDMQFRHGWGRSQIFFIGGYVGRAKLGLMFKSDGSILWDKYWLFRDIPVGENGEYILDIGKITIGSTCDDSDISTENNNILTKTHEEGTL